MPSINSSCLSWAEYNDGNLELTFRNGRTYTLRGVPVQLYYGLINAPSPGRYFQAYLKGRY
jgi:hypothetical protein